MTKFKRVKLTLLNLGKRKRRVLSLSLSFFLLPLLFPAPLPIPMKRKRQTMGKCTPSPQLKRHHTWKSIYLLSSTYSCLHNPSFSLLTWSLKPLGVWDENDLQVNNECWRHNHSVSARISKLLQEREAVFKNVRGPTVICRRFRGFEFTYSLRMTYGTNAAESNLFLTNDSTRDKPSLNEGFL